MPGFFDLTDPDNAAMLGLAAGLLQAGAPQRLPMPTGAAFGNGLAAALNAGLAAQRLQPRPREAPAVQQAAALQQLGGGAPPVSYGPLLPYPWPMRGKSAL
jgi:hypothetical protein